MKEQNKDDWNVDKDEDEKRRRERSKVKRRAISLFDQRVKSGK